MVEIYSQSYSNAKHYIFENIFLVMSDSAEERITDFKRTLARKLYYEVASKVSPEVMDQVMREVLMKVDRPIREVRRPIEEQTKDDLSKSQ
jgi:hypothetical protein